MNSNKKTVKICSVIITILFLAGLGSGSSQAVQNQAAAEYSDDVYADLVVGVPGENIAVLFTQFDDAGIISVIYGSPAGLASPGSQTWDQRMEYSEDGLEPGDQFGSALASGDFNGDDYDDLAIGIPYEDFESAVTIKNAGSVIVLYGSLGGLNPAGVHPDQMWHQNSSGIIDSVEEYDWFGLALASGDFDDDSFDDLAIGAPGEDSQTKPDIGVVQVIYGSEGGLSAAGNQQWEQYDWGGSAESESYDHFGRSLAAGKFRWRTHDALAIGVAEELS